MLQCQVGSHVAAADGHSSTKASLTLPASSSLLALRVASPAVVVADGGSDSAPLLAVLVGRGLASPGISLHCRSRGQHQVLTVLRARRGDPGAAAQAARQAWMDAEPATPPSSDRRSDQSSAPPSSDEHDSGDSASDSSVASSSAPRRWAQLAGRGSGGSSCSASSERSLGNALPSGLGADPSAGPSACPAAGSAEAALLEGLELGPAEDAVLVQLPQLAPTQAWGLFEFEVATGERGRGVVSGAGVWWWQEAQVNGGTGCCCLGGCDGGDT